MRLPERVTELERRLAELEAQARPGRSGSEDPLPGRTADFWALESWKEKLGEAGAARGGVLFTGAVGLPSEKHYEWQREASTDALLEEDWTDTADAFAALGHTVRLRLLQEIIQEPRTVADLAALEELGTTGQIYHHIRQLTSAGWLHSVGRGAHEVPPQRVVPLLVMLTAAHG